jgi:superfamily II DNA or RNA helicase
MENPNFISLNGRLLKRAKDINEYGTYSAALEWDLVDPIVIEGKDDLKSENKWSGILEPFDHQVTNLINFCRRLPVTLLADDVGLGKTISAGLICSELIARKRISKILIVCPKLLIPQWAEELKVKFGLESKQAIGKDIVESCEDDEAVAVITTYQSARIYFDIIEKAGFSMLILDEAHKLRNLYGTNKPPKIAICFKKALENRIFKYVLMLTATPIQNRLWDIYSLIDLLTVARGHENPFGNEGLFARKYIEDNRTEARHLRPDMKESFRSIVYGYMSRVRRIDAKLVFPERVVQLNKVKPTPEEMELFTIIEKLTKKPTEKEIEEAKKEGKPIKILNRLAEVSILQAWLSSPHAFATQLQTMARNETIDKSFADEAKIIAAKITLPAKLKGLGKLIDNLIKEKPEEWRVVVFTTRRETQTTIQAFLEEKGTKCGLINGDSGVRNQETVKKFWKIPPDVRVIISTEAGLEGVNLQAGNVLVNYDLPWNPMIVEQRIGRIQRLKSSHANVCIFNIVLQNTFEEYIVGRLMEKLQMASHAIGDVESLLEAAGLQNDEKVSFEEKIRELVMASIEGKNIDLDVQMAEKSISDAKQRLKEEEQHINEIFGGMADSTEKGPKSPRLPVTLRAMNPAEFTLAALKLLGAKLSYNESGVLVSELAGKRELIRFNEDQISLEKSSLYEPGSLSFERLVGKVINNGLHLINDLDSNILEKTDALAAKWANSFGGASTKSQIEGVYRNFNGYILVRVRATVAHDSYERLVEIRYPSESGQERHNLGKKGLNLVEYEIDDASALGISNTFIQKNALSDTGISEFCRFYNQRKLQEVKAAGNDERKKAKLEDDFTPRLEMIVVGFKGTLQREIEALISYRLDNVEYKSSILVLPCRAEILKEPERLICAVTKRTAPADCFAKCSISGKQSLRHLLVESEFSGRLGLPEYATECSLSKKRALSDEVEKSSITGSFVARTLLKTSPISGKKAEPQFFSMCDFSLTEVLENELAVSQVSGKKYRIDESLKSTVSGKTGHKNEFVFCELTNQPLLEAEAEKCEITGKKVMPGLLELCTITEKKVLPSELEKSSVSGKKALKKYFVTSSISEAKMFEQEAVKSVSGKYCSPLEAKVCAWSGRKTHPDDMKICQLTGVAFHSEFASIGTLSMLEPLVNLLNGIDRSTANQKLWPQIAKDLSVVLKNSHCKVESASASPNNTVLALCAELKTWLGLKTSYIGLLYSTKDQKIIGRMATGTRTPNGWVQKA